MKASWTTRAALAALLIGGSTFAGSAGAFGGGPGGPLGHLEHRLSAAGLPAQTTQAIYQVLDQARSQRRTLQAQVAPLRQQLHQLLDQPTVDQQAVLALADQLDGAEAQLRRQDLDTLLKVRGLVTQQEWESLMPGRRGGEPAAPPAPQP